jgi:hypothetical protein
MTGAPRRPQRASARDDYGINRSAKSACIASKS